ncbi:hypothetical protein [Spiroplasma endosymbiont of Amphimallon solstitiale]|uniref:hypothetical protein n=1 Tax=Spiroplasma endosymbiont of Amphimallon solstitiale TaxID=3066288 RepID=UPI00313CCB06
MISLSISNFYKIFNFETLIKKIRYFHKPNISLLEEKLIELENNSNIPIFNKSEVLKIQDSINEVNKTYKVIYSNTKKIDPKLTNSTDYDSDQFPLLNKKMILFA